MSRMKSGTVVLNRRSHTIEAIPAWEADSSLACHEIPCLALNPVVYYRVHSKLLDFIPRHINPVYNITCYVF
jgi:hypothetical protein